MLTFLLMSMCTRTDMRSFFGIHRLHYFISFWYVVQFLIWTFNHEMHLKNNHFAIKVFAIIVKEEEYNIMVNNNIEIQFHSY